MAGSEDSPACDLRNAQIDASTLMFEIRTVLEALSHGIKLLLKKIPGGAGQERASRSGELCRPRRRGDGLAGRADGGPTQLAVGASAENLIG